MVNNDRLLATFLELVQIDSETGNEATIQPILKRKFEELNLQVEEDDAGKYDYLGANNLVCTLPSSEGYENSDKIYFTSHMDTVAPGIGVKPNVADDGYIYSDGTTVLGADDKAGLAAILETIQVIKEQNLPHGQVQFVITVGEESGLEGAKVLNSSLLDADYGYAVDASSPVGTTVIGAPTQMKLSATIYGKKAHASTPDMGVSAINIAAKAISEMSLGRIDDETTANIGRFEGGSATNVVADEVTLQAEARSHSEDKINQQVAHMKEVFENTAESYGCTASVTIKESYKGFKVDANAKVAKIATLSASQLNLDPQTKVGGGGSDASIINTYGIPSVILGVGYENIHSKNERMEIKSLQLLTQQLLKIVELTH
ncbi:M20/M25/M40 family metallo-hydrolase [Staphylococcus kloosii]|jgi:tripeptide aminopeptidase|uniref:M20/M25/M40 family metallo-hydrolase n=1 Tax=Staphylococcus kloosii TaxID=29384 RepID=UPI0018A098EC|nr:M20/M25/M40 family metallo-hydrolase [Staphylococcus kloosii]MBF7024297.1 M20/M25/M40 family metallo-hydrolase [Staphylococcus kloosii]